MGNTSSSSTSQVIETPSVPIKNSVDFPFFVINYGKGLDVNDKSDKFLQSLDRDAISKLYKTEGKKTVIDDGTTYHQIIHSAAVKAEYFSGKWNIVCETAVIDDIWKIIGRLCYNGKLGPTVKVSRKSDRYPTHIICVYTEDYRDITEVIRLHKTFTQALESSGFKDKYTVTGFKCDYYTEMGIAESQNLPPGTVTEPGVYNMNGVLIKSGMREMLWILCPNLDD